MNPLDIAFLLSLIAGGGYLVATALMGGLSHAVGHLGQGVDIGGHHFGDGSGHIDAGGGHHVGDAGGHIVAGPGSGHGHVDGGSAPVHGEGHTPPNLHPHVPNGNDPEDSRAVGIAAYLNPMIISSFLFGFGGIGVSARLLHLALGSAAIAAILGGCCMYWVAGAIIIRMFAASQATSHNRRDDLVGIRGTVTAPISRDHPGMISYTVGGSRQSLRASTDDEPIPTGATVRIRKVTRSTATVTSVEERDRPDLLYH